jgi:hypothetical protein
VGPLGFQRITRTLTGAVRSGDGEELPLAATGGVFIADAGSAPGAVAIRFDEDRDELPLATGRTFRRPFRRLYLVHGAGLAGTVDLVTFEQGQEIDDAGAERVLGFESFRDNTRCYGMLNAHQTAFLSITLNLLRAHPIVIPRRTLIDALVFDQNAAGAAGSVVRVGLYRNRGEGDHYPTTLLTPDLIVATDGANGPKLAAVSLLLDAGLYWWAYCGGVAAVSLRTVPAAQLLPIFGFPTTASWAASPAYFTTAYPYAPLPDPFPAAIAIATSTTTLCGLVRGRFT